MTYTTHGHHIPGTVQDQDHKMPIARCGGIGLCAACSIEAADILATKNLEYKTAREDLATLIACETSGLNGATPEQDDYDLADIFIKIINGNARHELPTRTFIMISNSLV